MTDGGAVMAPARANPVGETAPAPAPAAPGAPAAPPGAPAAAAAESGAAEAEGATLKEDVPRGRQLAVGTKQEPRGDAVPKVGRNLAKVGVPTKAEGLDPSHPRGNAKTDDPASIEENVRKSACWIFKYQTETSRRENGVRIRSDQICYKEENRGGIGLSADRCEELLGDHYPQVSAP